MGIYQKADDVIAIVEKGKSWAWKILFYSSGKETRTQSKEGVLSPGLKKRFSTAKLLPVVDLLVLYTRFQKVFVTPQVYPAVTWRQGCTRSHDFK